MSDDLISGSALIQSLRNNVLVDVTTYLEEAIDAQPTAYDVDKVVEQLESESKQFEPAAVAEYVCDNLCLYSHNNDLTQEELDEICNKCNLESLLGGRRTNMAIKNYDPNIYWGIHTIRITIQQWGYVGHIIRKVHGNCKGMTVMDFDPGITYDESFESDCCLRFDEDGEGFRAILKDADGNTLEIKEETRDFNKMVVAVEIIDFVEEYK